MRLDLIDELQLSLSPYVAGEGTRLFDGVPKSYRLDLVSSAASSNGIRAAVPPASLTQGHSRTLAHAAFALLRIEDLHSQRPQPGLAKIADREPDLRLATLRSGTSGQLSQSAHQLRWP